MATFFCEIISQKCYHKMNYPLSKASGIAVAKISKNKSKNIINIKSLVGENSVGEESINI